MKVFQNGKLFAEIFFIKKLNLAFHAKFKSQELRVKSKVNDSRCITLPLTLYS
jgi:hypothetical protein